MTEVQAINIVHQGGQINCTKDEYPRIRTALEVHHFGCVVRKQLDAAKRVETEKSRLDVLHSFNPNWKHEEKK